MKKIIFFIESLSGGGAEKVLTTLVKNIDKTKFSITVLTIVNTGVYLKEISNYCTLKYILPNYKELKNPISKLQYRIRYKQIYLLPVEEIYKKYVTEKYDVEIAFVEGFVTKLVAASWNPNSKKICWLHIDMEKNPYADAYFTSLGEERAIYKKYDNIIGVSQSVKKSFEKKFCLPDSVQVIYNPIDKEEIVNKAQQVKISKPKELTLISIGRLEYQKGYDRLIKILSELQNSEWKYTLWILGEGTQRKELEHLIHTLKLNDKVILLGYKENPYGWLNAADVFLCSSRAEGFSLAIAEAMVLGKPVLSVECSGPNEILNYGEFGKMIPNTDKDLEKLLIQLFKGSIDLKRYSLLSLKRTEFFELPEIIQKVENLFL